MTERYKYSNDGYLNENFRLFHLKDSSGQEKDFHFHEFDKIVILISGKVDYTVEGTAYKLEPWDILLVRHHMIHKAAIDLSVPYERIIIYLDSAYVERFAPNAGLMDCFASAEKRHFMKHVLGDKRVGCQEKQHHAGHAHAANEHGAVAASANDSGKLGNEAFHEHDYGEPNKHANAEE